MEGPAFLFSPLVTQIGPDGVILLNEPNLLCSSPVLDLLFSIYGVDDLFEMFEPNQPAAMILCAQALDFSITMFFDPTLDAVCHSAVKNVGSTGDEIHIVIMVLLAQRRSLHCASLRSG